MIDVIDISNYQHVTDMAAVAKEVKCVYHHAIEGGWSNPDYNPRKTAAVGLVPFGSYLFLRPGTPELQGSLFRSVVGDIAPGSPRAMVDVEVQGITAAEVRTVGEDLSAWMNCRPLLYGGMPLLCQLAKEEPALLEYPLWFAWYPNDASTVQRILTQFTHLRLGGFSTDPWDAPTIWQYSSKGTIPGITNNVDINTFWRGVSLNSILVPLPHTTVRNDMFVVPEWVNIIPGDTSCYRVIRNIDAMALFQAIGQCQVTEAPPDPTTGITSIPLNVPFDSISGIDMGDHGQQVIVGGTTGPNGHNTWNFHTNGINPLPQAVDAASVENLVKQSLVDIFSHLS